jgi:hypothetical protein
VPLSLIFCSVPPLWALAAPQHRARASPNTRGRFLKFIADSLEFDEGGIERIFDAAMNFQKRFFVIELGE